MAIQNIAMKAYTQALAQQQGKGNGIGVKKTLQNGMGRQDAFQQAMDVQSSPRADTARKTHEGHFGSQAFGDTVIDSLKNVNNMQSEKSRMIDEFASGKNQNVHELMITMQKASLAVSMTSAVRTKVMAAYKEIMQTHF